MTQYPRHRARQDYLVSGTHTYLELLSCYWNGYCVNYRRGANSEYCTSGKTMRYRGRTTEVDHEKYNNTETEWYLSTTPAVKYWRDSLSSTYRPPTHRAQGSLSPEDSLCAHSCSHVSVSRTIILRNRLSFDASCFRCGADTSRHSTPTRTLCS